MDESLVVHADLFYEVSDIDLVPWLQERLVQVDLHVFVLVRGNEGSLDRPPSLVHLFPTFK